MFDICVDEEKGDKVDKKDKIVDGGGGDKPGPQTDCPDPAEFDIPANVNLCNLPPGILPGDLEGVPEDILRENFPEIFPEDSGGDDDDGGSSGGSIDPVSLGLPADINLDNLPVGIVPDDLVGLYI